MNKKQEKCFKFQVKCNNVDLRQNMCNGKGVLMFKLFATNEKWKLLKSLHYKDINCDDCDKFGGNINNLANQQQSRIINKE